MQRVLDILRRIEDWLLAILVLILVVLAGGQIVLRDFFHTGISWADPLMRQLVLWTGMLGALQATPALRPAAEPLVSVVVPVDDGIARTLVCLEAFADATPDGWFELVLVERVLILAQHAQLPRA